MAQLQSQPAIHKNLDETILVVKRSTLFKTHGAWSGIKAVNFDEYMQVINANKEFQPRSLMEQDPTFKQIIPYLIFKHEDRYFLMRRAAKATEQRLQNKYTLGIGGHVREEDMDTDSLFDWARREFHEEINYAHEFTFKPIGLLNDDSNDVGKVHIGFVFLLEGTSSNISIKSELTDGQLLTLEEIKPYFANLESWSQLVFEHLLHNNSSI